MHKNFTRAKQNMRLLLTDVPIKVHLFFYNQYADGKGRAL